jgi:hypothetical protein
VCRATKLVVEIWIAIVGRDGLLVSSIEAEARDGQAESLAAPRERKKVRPNKQLLRAPCR